MSQPFARYWPPDAFPPMDGYDEPSTLQEAAAIWRAGQEWGRRGTACHVMDVAADVRHALLEIDEARFFRLHLPRGPAWNEK